jgi:hypothetical protein
MPTTQNREVQLDRQTALERRRGGVSGVAQAMVRREFAHRVDVLGVSGQQIR